MNVLRYQVFCIVYTNMTYVLLPCINNEFIFLNRFTNSAGRHGMERIRSYSTEHCCITMMGI